MGCQSSKQSLETASLIVQRALTMYRELCDYLMLILPITLGSQHCFTPLLLMRRWKCREGSVINASEQAEVELGLPSDASVTVECFPNLVPLKYL